MLRKRLIICLDVRDGKTTKGVRFQDNIDIGDPVAMARRYYEEGVDELVFYDITASSERRGIMIDVVQRVAEQVFIPLSVGGGITSSADMHAVLLAGAEKVSVNSAAVRNPQIISDGALHYGRQCIVLGMDVRADAAMASGYRVIIDGGRTTTELDALDWARRAEQLGAGEIVLNSIDADGGRNGYDIALTKLISDAVGIPVVASGGAGTPQHVVDVLSAGHADAALVASMVHYNDYTISDIKQQMKQAGVSVRYQ